MSKQTPTEKFEYIWYTLLNGPALEKEYKFVASRRFRADYAHPPTRTLIEIEGGTWVRGRHVRPGGYSKDAAKYNLAALGGYAVFRLTSDMVTEENIIPIIDYIKAKSFLLRRLEWAVAEGAELVKREED